MFLVHGTDNTTACHKCAGCCVCGGTADRLAKSSVVSVGRSSSLALHCGLEYGLTMCEDQDNPFEHSADVAELDLAAMSASYPSARATRMASLTVEFDFFPQYCVVYLCMLYIILCLCHCLCCI